MWRFCMFVSVPLAARMQRYPVEERRLEWNKRAEDQEAEEEEKSRKEEICEQPDAEILS